mmetsp:Transcript_27935/g.70296  ORF Transcript_27935/g.70296 Transcript_27935/m.70296 type:complete len:330 (+) Transcript_27935:667-1656(+)
MRAKTVTRKFFCRSTRRSAPNSTRRWTWSSLVSSCSQTCPTRPCWQSSHGCWRCPSGRSCPWRSTRRFRRPCARTGRRGRRMARSHPPPRVGSLLRLGWRLRVPASCSPCAPHCPPSYAGPPSRYRARPSRSRRPWTGTPSPCCWARCCERRAHDPAWRSAARTRRPGKGRRWASGLLRRRRRRLRRPTRRRRRVRCCCLANARSGARRGSAAGRRVCSSGRSASTEGLARRARSTSAPTKRASRGSTWTGTTRPRRRHPARPTASTRQPPPSTSIRARTAGGRPTGKSLSRRSARSPSQRWLLARADTDHLRPGRLGFCPFLTVFDWP